MNKKHNASRILYQRFSKVRNVLAYLNILAKYFKRKFVHRFSSIKHSSGDTHSGASKVALLDHHYRVEPAPQLRPLPRAYAGRLRTVSLSGQHARRHCPWAVCAVCVGGTNSGKTPQPSATARCRCRTRMLSGCSAVSSVPPLASLLTHSCATPCRGWEAAKFWSPTMRVRTA